MLVRSRMTSHVHTASPETTLAEALSMTRAHRIRHLPILEEERLVGIVTDRDLRLAMPPIWADEHDELMQALHTRRVGELMITDIITVQPDTPVEDAAKLLYSHRIGCLPVLEDGRLVGILTETDLLRAFAELFGARTPSRRFEVQMPNRPGELARVVRLIGIEKKINIAGMVVPPLRGGEDCVAIMHLQVDDASEISHALRKVGYRVGSPSLENDPDADFIPTEEYRPSAHGDPPFGRAMAEL
ncbi:MAG TPA: CBS and ACT domain-containing protein [Longimicrobiales bacterium]|nr:CBS and ACT domain-containing protein [Longimicrobiales bacterium]